MQTLEILWNWLPRLLEAFSLNLLIGLLATAIGTVGGLGLGALQLSASAWIARTARLVTQVARNSPWLVSLFYVMYLLPFEITLGSSYVTIPDWLKATIGLSIPALGNMSEIVRGGLRSIALTQWEAAAALGYDRVTMLRTVIVPQAARRMLPPWMNLYCVITLSTVLANIVGVSELITTARQLLVAEQDPRLLLPVYSLVMLLFFLYIYPISLFTKSLERKWSHGE